MVEMNGGTPLIEALTVEYGPRAQLGRYFLTAISSMRERGIELHISRDPFRLDRLGPDYDAAKPARFPGMDARLAGFGPAHFFTLEGWNSAGRIAFVAAARLLEIERSFADELESFRLFYADPDRQRLGGDRVEVTAESAFGISGRTALTGSYWVNPAMRGLGLARFFPLICRSYCLTLWDIQHTVGLLHRDDAERGLGLVYGERPAEPWIRFRGRWQDDSYLLWGPRAFLEGQVLQVDEEINRSTRVADALLTRRSPSGAVQGSISRS